MIQLQGTITIKHIRGSRGIFAVGNLVTDIGNFAVKDELLGQYEEGRYTGRFFINHIFPSSYVIGGRAMVEVRASVSQMIVDDETEAEGDQVPAKVVATLAGPDPLDEAPPPAPPKEVPLASNGKPEETLERNTSPEPEADDAKLFGEHWDDVSGRRPVKLDPTADRAQFRAMVARLREIRYRFSRDDQTWYAV